MQHAIDEDTRVGYHDESAGAALTGDDHSAAIVEANDLRGAFDMSEHGGMVGDDVADIDTDGVIAAHGGDGCEQFALGEARRFGCCGFTSDQL